MPQFFVTAALGLEPLLADELRNLGGKDVKEVRAGVSFSGELALAYTVCLWSRLASRVLLPLDEFLAGDSDQLYQHVLTIDWQEHLSVENSFAVDCTLVRAQIEHSKYAALRVKDAIVDQFRSRCGERPGIALDRPDLRINLHVHGDRATLSLDLSGDSLHRRGYRIDGIDAPLKENLAAAILVRAGWPDICDRGGALIDPFCGSGTLPLEAALISIDTAPGLLREYFGFLGWRRFDPEPWRVLREEALARQQQAMQKPRSPILGYDADSKAIKAAWQHAQKAGLDKEVHFEKRGLREFSAPSGTTSGLLVANPPYGERLGSAGELPALYNLLGEKLTRHCQGWKAAVITSNPRLGRAIGLRADKINTLYNGAIKCQLLQFVLDAGNRWQSLAQGAGRAIRKPLSPGAEMFANRLRKNLKNLKKWAKREGVRCYRLYDADLPEYAVAVDLYEDEVHLQEYRAPKGVDPQKATERLKEVLDALPQVLDLPPDQLHLKVREPQKGKNQYQKQARRGQFKEVVEGNCRFLVNLTDYLDTGLFLDHRPTRRLVQELAAGTRFLNLFAYTGSVTVHALKGGARSSISVDMSRTYLDWARKNLILNGFDPQRQELVQADCLAWIAQAQHSMRGAFDLIFLDPPTFSNSKTMQGTFDVQRDHADLLRQVIPLLAADGTLIFSNNLRNFRLDEQIRAEMNCEEITRQTIPPDFARQPRIHNCWIMRH